MTGTMAASTNSQPAADDAQAWTATYVVKSSCESRSYLADQFVVQVLDASGQPTSDVSVDPVTKVNDTTFTVALTSKVAGTYTVKTALVAEDASVNVISFLPLTVSTSPVDQKMTPATPAIPTTVPSTTPVVSIVPTPVPSTPVSPTTASGDVTAPPTSLTSSSVPVAVSTTQGASTPVDAKPMAPTAAGQPDGRYSTLLPAMQTVAQSCDGTSDGGTVTAVVKDADGNPVEGVTVGFDATDSVVTRYQTTGLDGLATITIPDPGIRAAEWGVGVNAYLPGWIPLQGSPALVDFQLAPGCPPPPVAVQVEMPIGKFQGEPMDGTLIVTDSVGNRISGLDLSKLTLTPSSSDVTVSPVTDQGDGEYSYTLNSFDAVDGTLTVAYDGETYSIVKFEFYGPAWSDTRLGTLSVEQATDGSQSYQAVVENADVYGNPIPNSLVTFSVSGDATFGAGLTSAAVRTDSQGRASVGLSVLPYTGTPLTFTVSATVDGPPAHSSPTTVTIGGQECMDSPTLSSGMVSSDDAQPVADGVQSWTVTYALASSCGSQSYSADQFDVRVFDAGGNPTSDVAVGSVTKVSDTTFQVAFTSKVAGTYTVKTSWVAVGPVVDTITFSPAAAPELPRAQTTVPSASSTPTMQSSPISVQTTSGASLAQSTPTNVETAQGAPTVQGAPTSELGSTGPVEPTTELDTSTEPVSQPMPQGVPTMWPNVSPDSVSASGASTEPTVEPSVTPEPTADSDTATPSGTPVALQAPVVTTADDQVLAGTGVPGTIITVSDAQGGVLGRPIVNADGTWRMTTPVGLTSGSVVSVSVTDGDGNVSSPVQVTLTASASSEPTGAVVASQSPSGVAVPVASGTVPVTVDQPQSVGVPTQSSSTPVTLQPGGQTVTSGSSQGPTTAPGPVVPQVQPTSGPVVQSTSETGVQPTSGTTVQPMSGTAVQLPSVAAVPAPAPSATTASIELSSMTLSPGQSVVVTGHNWAPGEQVTITVHSTPIQFPPVTVDPDGSLPSMTVAVPADFDPGTHTLTAVGSQSGTVTMSFQVVAAAQTPTGSVLSGAAPVGSASGQLPSASTGGRAVPAAGLGWLVGVAFVVAGLAVAGVRRRKA